MFSGGLFQAMPGMREALTGPQPSREWLEAVQDRCQRRMHSTMMRSPPLKEIGGGTVVLAIQ